MPEPQFDNSFLKPKTATSGSPILKKESKGAVVNIATRPQFTEDLLKQKLTPETDIDISKAAELHPLSQATRIPVENLYENYDEVKKVIQNKKDEGRLRSLQASYKVADYTLRKNWLNWRWLNGDQDPNIDTEIAKLDRQIEQESQFITDDGLLDKAMNTATGLLPLRLKSTGEGVKGGLATSMLVTGATAAIAPPAVPVTSLASFVAGTTAFSTNYIIKVEAGSLADTLRNLKDDKGNPVDPRIVRTFSMAYGAVAGALEFSGIKLLLKTVPGLDKAMKAIVQKSVTKLIKDGSVAKFLSASSGRYAKFLAEETIIENAQEGASMVFEEIAKNAHELKTDGVIDDITLDEVMTRFKETTFSSILGFGILGAPGHAMQTLPGLIDYRSQVREKALQDLMPEDTNSDYGQEMTNTYERVKNLFFGERDLRVIKNKNEGRILINELSNLVQEGQTAEELAVAMSLYLDSKNNPEAVEAALVGEKYVEPKTVATFKSKKGNVYTKKDDKWYDKEGNEVTDKHKIKAIEKGTQETLTGKAVRLGKSATKEEIAEAKVKLKKIDAKVENMLAEAKEAALKGDVEKATKLVSEAGFIGQKEAQSLREMIEASEGRDFGRKQKVSKPLSEVQTRLIEMSKNLTQKQKAFVNKIGNIYDVIAEEALGDEIIFNTLNNFTARSWVSDKKTSDILSRLTQTTVHAKERRLPTIVEGWTEGLSMKTHSIVDNLTMYREDMIKVIEQKRFVQALAKGKTEAGNPVFSTKRLPGYERVEMPKYTPREGTTYFAPQDVARNVNNIFGVSSLDKLVGIKTLTKINAMLKKIALSTSLFHNVAFFRSFYLGGKSVQWENMNPFTAHREGVEMINNMDEMVKIGVYNGLTLSIIQDWEEELLDMKSDLDKITNKHTKSKRIRSLVSDLWRRQVNFTFGTQGAGLKIKAFAYEFQNECKKNPNENKNKVAARVASLINDDFGGLHLERMGRNKTYQHIFRLLALAPDWTESNIRTVTGMFKRESKGGYKAQRQLYQRFWARIILKSVAATAIMNTLLAGGDVEEAWDRYKEGVKDDWKNVAAIDITGLWHLFGMEPQNRKYFSVAGHFLDPVKYADILLGEPKILQHKASIVARLASDWLFNENWRGKRFKNLAEIPIGVREFAEYLDPDTYVTYAPEKRRGSFLETNFNFPAFLIHSLIGGSPIAFQNLLACLSGEQDVLSGISNTLGVRQPRRKRKRGWN